MNKDSSVCVRMCVCVRVCTVRARVCACVLPSSHAQAMASFSTSQFRHFSDGARCLIMRSASHGTTCVILNDPRCANLAACLPH